MKDTDVGNARGKLLIVRSTSSVKFWGSRMSLRMCSRFINDVIVVALVGPHTVVAGGPWNVGVGSVQKVLSSQSSCKTSLHHNWFAK